MGIFSAMTTAVSGLNVQSYALENISGNIANSQTTGFKKVETSFADLVSEAASGKQGSGSVANNSRYSNTVQGDVKQSSTSTNMAIRGDGYFVVQRPSGFQNNSAQFSSSDLYTRRGDFDVDREGYLVNAAGLYLKGVKVDQATGNVSGNVPEPIKISASSIAAQKTSNIQYGINLPVTPQIVGGSGRGIMKSSEVGGTTDWAAPVAPATTNTVAVLPATVTKANATKFIEQSLTGGSITVYDTLGTPQSLDLRWAKVDDNKWDLYYRNGDIATAAAGDNVYTRINGSAATDKITFSETTGKMTAPAAGALTVTSLKINGTDFGSPKLVFNSDQTSQYYTPSGQGERASLSQDGYSSGERVGMQITDTGRVQAVFSNNKRLDLYQVSLATFAGQNGLRRVDGNAWAATAESGAPVLGASGKIIGSSLEASNVDISDEFTKMIVTQQAYAANTKIVTTSNEMLQQTINMIR